MTNDLTLYDNDRIKELTLALETSGVLENIIMKNDLSGLNPTQRIGYVKELCNVLGLNPASQPFAFIEFKNKLVLYPTKNCAEQLRHKYNISVKIVSEGFMPDGSNPQGFYKVVTEGQIGNRVDQDISILHLIDKYKPNTPYLKGQDLADAIMKAVTKSKRRLTLSMCGLSFDKTNYDSPADFDDLEDEGFRPISIDSTTGEVLTPEPTEKPFIDNTKKTPELNSKTSNLEEIYDLAVKYMHSILDPQGYNVTGADVTGWLNQISESWFSGKYQKNGWKLEKYKDLQRADLEKILSGFHKTDQDPMSIEAKAFSTSLEAYKKDKMIKFSMLGE